MQTKSLYKLNERESCHPVVVAYYFKEWKGFHMPFHSHDAIEIMYVISGECKVEVRDNVFQMKKGQFIFIDSGVSHRLVVEENLSCRMLNLEFEFVLTELERSFPSIRELADQSNQLRALIKLDEPFFLLKDLNGVYSALRNLVLELDNSNKDNYLMIQILISQLLLLIARNVAEAKEKTPQQADVYIKKVLYYIHQNYDYDIKIKDLASFTHLHPSYLHRIFKESMGCTVMQYLTKIRMDKAKMLLVQTDIPVTDVSNFVGINSSQYFSKIFKKHTGTTPLYFRRKAIDNSR